MNKQSAFRKCLTLLVLAGFVLAGCNTATPTAMPAPTIEPTPTPVPPTATPTIVPTPTPIPVPRVENVQFSDNAQMANRIGPEGTFKAGPSAIYMSIDHADIPITSSLTVQFRRNNGTVLFNKTGTWPVAATGTYTQALITDTHLLIPGTYHLIFRVAGKLVESNFRIDTDGDPGAPLLTENFDNNQLGWAEHSDQIWSAQVQNGQLAMVVLKPKEIAYTGSTLITLKDFDLSVTVSTTKVSSLGYSSILFRYDNTGGYVFTVFTDGRFEVDLSSMTGTKGLQTLLALQRSSAIQRGAATNQLRIVAKGNQFAFYINDQLVGTLTDNKFSAGGLEFAIADIYQAGAHISFDDLRVTVPRDEVAVMSTPIAPAAPKGTPIPKATAVPSAPPLLTVVRHTIELVNGFKGALFGGGESCADFFRQFNGIVNGPTFDVSGQPSNVQSAYGLYRQALAVAGSKATVFNDICSSGGGVVGKLDVLVEIKLLDQALDLLGQAERLLTQ